MTRIDILIRYLIAEEPQYSEIQIPEDLQGKRDLFRALRNVREPKPVSEEFLRLQDEELQAQLQERGVVELDDIVGVCRGEKFFAPTGKQLSLSTGRAKITKAYNLPCKYVIHTVGPIIPDGIPTAFQKEQLASCYRNIMVCAGENGLGSVAFCCISTGEFRFPNQLAAEIAVQTVKDYLTVHPDCSVRQVVFNVFKNEDRKIYQPIIK